VPGIDRDVYLVLDDFGRLRQAWRETNLEDTDLESVLNDLLEGHPIRERENVTQGFEPMLKQW
jgi:hypothetical protein